MGLTPLFELFAGPLSFHLANYVQRFGWGYSSKKSNPRLPRQTGVNRTIHTVFKVVQYLRWHDICVTLYYCIQRSGSTEPPSFTVFILIRVQAYWSQYSKIRCRWSSQLHTVFNVYWSQHRHQAHESPESLLSVACGQPHFSCPASQYYGIIHEL